MSSDVTISPVLLQAVSQTLTTVSQDQPSSSLTTPITMATPPVVKQEMIDSLRGESQIPSTNEEQIQQMAQIIQNLSSNAALNQGTSSVQSDTSGIVNSWILAEDIKAMLKCKMNQSRSQQEQTTTLTDNTADGASVSDVGMVDVLAALSSQMKAKDLSNTTTINDNSKLSENMINASGSNEASRQYIIYDNSRVPSPVNSVVVSESGSGNAPVLMVSQDNQSVSSVHTVQQDMNRGNYTMSDIDKHPSNLIMTYAEDVTMQPMSMGIQMEVHTLTPQTHREEVPTGFEPCPICGDAISGYHYGIFSCESCKGFFKRTVQNKKTFSCHRKGDCDVTKSSRKKCPACRFAKCLIMGMKLEAIRRDRMRGGRSSYDGCSPHGRPKYEMKTPTPKSVQKRPRATNPNRPPQTAAGLAMHKNLENVNVMLPSGENIPGSALLSMLNRTTKTSTEGAKPFVPHLLTEIMNVESYLCEDENSTEFPPERLSENDPTFMLSLLQLAELRLYKLVRWARNLPQFSSISTDDQILLLQNCWADLLLFNCCMRSIQSTTEIFLPMGKSIDMEKAERLGHGADDIVSRLLCITEQLRKLQVDQYEFVALKVLMLISPDVKALKEPHRAREHQEAVCEALSLYTNSHYPQLQNKFGEMLLRLPEVTRVSMMGKDILNSVMPPEFQSCGLLFELLKGDGIKDETS